MQINLSHLIREIKMKAKHNKKRNTAFLYEALTRELTKCVVNNDIEEKKKVLSLIKSFFSKNCVLREELNLYKELLDVEGIEISKLEKLIESVYATFNNFDKNSIYQEQSKLISRINKELEGAPLSNFIPNYKSLATIYQFLNSKNHKQRIMLEQQIIENLTSSQENTKELKPLSNLEFKCLIERFNKEYSNELLDEQKNLINKYIKSFSDDVEFKTYLNEEIWRLRDSLETSLISEEISSDENMLQKAKEVIELLENFKNRQIDNRLLEDTLKIQKLVNEIENKEEK
jgi:hypothetical protein